MSIELFADLNNQVLIQESKNYNYLNEMNKIYKIFNFVKNEVMYENTTEILKASETLVFRRGNNLSKQILLYSLLRLNNIHCYLTHIIVKDNFKCIFTRSNESLPWFFVHVNTLSKSIFLDCSLDASLTRCLNISYTGDGISYSPLDYSIKNSALFTCTSNYATLMKPNFFPHFFNKDNHSRLYSLV